MNQEKWKEVEGEGRIMDEWIIEFIIEDSQIVNVKAKLFREKYLLN